MLRNSSSKGLTVIYRRCTVMKNFQRHLHRSSPISKVINPKSLDAPRVSVTGTFSTNFSAKSHPQNMEKVTIENILSDANKHRVQKALATSKELMKFPWMYDGKTGRESPRACVLIPFCTVNGEPSVLFTLRATDLNDHQGEVSFPGGKMDPSDNDLIHTAVRECYEELGVPSDRVDVWGMMKSGFPSKAGKYAVWGVIANLGEVDVTDLKLDENEFHDMCAWMV
ncbi:mitochondrial coenzyme A diphosphatase NUDT8-like isoform X2 [Lineus longissimus]|uniref:mitochondrial coenzyme A diphosphatase NUDT8-like isoform X2 n=1 Tax=Lineus longissimus TaxID=88925 RepID=UPI00315DFAF5